VRPCRIHTHPKRQPQCSTRQHQSVTPCCYAAPQIFDARAPPRSPLPLHTHPILNPACAPTPHHRYPDIPLEAKRCKFCCSVQPLNPEKKDEETGAKGAKY